MEIHLSIDLLKLNLFVKKISESCNDLFGGCRIMVMMKRQRRVVGEATTDGETKPVAHGSVLSVCLCVLLTVFTVGIFRTNNCT